MNDEVLFKLRMRAAGGDMAAQQAIARIEAEMRIRTEAGLAAWGHRPPLQSTILSGPPRVVTGSWENHVTVSDCEVTVRDRNSKITEVVDWPE